jgi:hypothetical protein
MDTDRALCGILVLENLIYTCSSVLNEIKVFDFPVRIDEEFSLTTESKIARKKINSLAMSCR